jgi:hypothetical protein
MESGIWNDCVWNMGYEMYVEYVACAMSMEYGIWNMDHPMYAEHEI